MGNLAHDIRVFIRSAHELLAGADTSTLIQSAALGGILPGRDIARILAKAGVTAPQPVVVCGPAAGFCVSPGAVPNPKPPWSLTPGHLLT